MELGVLIVANLVNVLKRGAWGGVSLPSSDDG